MSENIPPLETLNCSAGGVAIQDQETGVRQPHAAATSPTLGCSKR